MGAPATLPADFQGWDKAPATLPADFDKWDAGEPAAPNAGLAPPAGPSRTIPDTDEEPTFGHVQTTLGRMGKDAAKNIWDVSTPGIAASFTKRFLPGVLPRSIEKDTTPLKELPNEIGATMAPVVAGGVLEEGPPGVGSAAERPRFSLNQATAAAPEESSVISRIGDVAKRRIGHIPGVQAVKDLDYIVRGDGAPEAPPPPTPKPPIPETNGMQWGTGGRVPLEMRGERLPVYPGASYPAVPPPEVLNPSLVSPSRTLPGQIGVEVTRPGFTPPEPLPPRSGLMLESPRDAILRRLSDQAERIQDIEAPAVPPEEAAAPAPVIRPGRGLKVNGKNVDPNIDLSAATQRAVDIARKRRGLPVQ